MNFTPSPLASFLSPHRASRGQPAWLALLLSAALAPSVLATAIIGNIFVSNYSGTTPNVEEFTPAGVGTVFSAFTSFKNGPLGIAFDNFGNLFAVNIGDGTIDKITPNGTRTVFVSPGFFYMNGLAVDSANNVYVAFPVDNKVMKFTPAGVSSVLSISGLNTPTGLTFDAFGNLFVANANGNNVLKVTPGGTTSVFATGSFVYDPSAMAFDSAGNMFVSNYQNASGGNGFISKFTPAGVGSMFASSGLFGPAGLAFDTGGNLFVANNTGGKITKFTPGGAASTFATGLNDPAFIAIRTVAPEPSAMLLLAGTGFALLAARRRRAQA